MDVGRKSHVKINLKTVSQYDHTYILSLVIKVRQGQVTPSSIRKQPFSPLQHAPSTGLSPL